MGVYRVIKQGSPVAAYPDVTLMDNGCLVCRRDERDRVDLLLAPGQWDSVFWDDE